MTNQKKSNTQSDTEEMLQQARERFKLAAEAEAEMRRLALEDLEFRAGEQWPTDIRNEREADDRPCLTINKLPQFIRQVTNDQRQNRPAIKISPVDNQADVETAKIFQGLIRNIEMNSNADVAYDTAFEGTAIKGLGYFRVITDYSDALSFDQEIKIKRVRNSFSVYMDPYYQEPDGSDAAWGFIVETMSADEFKAQFPDATLSKMQDWKSIGDNFPDWVKEDTCQVAEYFYKTYRQVTLLKLSTGEVVVKEDLKQELPEQIQVTAERKTTLPAIKWCKISGVDILEETDWVGQWIPIIPVIGDELDVDGKVIREGIVRHAKDPQRMFNFWASAETEAIALAPRAPFIGVAGQFEGFEEQWRTANKKSHPYLQYNAKTIAGQPAPPPQRNAFEPAVMAITQARMNSSDDLKATTGIYDASLGNKSNENSGIAIQRRNHQAQTNNFHYIDNLTRSIRHLGRILVDLIPKIYDTARTVRILGEDGKPEIVRINEIFQHQGESKIYNLTMGKYDVSVSTGPSYATKRQEAVESMMALTQAMPQTMQIAADLIVKNMDWNGAEEISERLKKTLPPGVVEDKNKEQKPLPPEVQQQLSQMNQMIDQLTKNLNQAHDVIDQKMVEIQSRERIEMAKIQTNLEIEMARMGSQEAQLLLKQEVANIHKRLEMLQFNEPIENELNESAQPQQGPDQSSMMMPTQQQQQQQPTGGAPSPGQPMGV